MRRPTRSMSSSHWMLTCQSNAHDSIGHAADNRCKSLDESTSAYSTTHTACPPKKGTQQTHSSSPCFLERLELVLAPADDEGCKGGLVIKHALQTAGRHTSCIHSVSSLAQHRCRNT
jgi:hypothetical protein